MEDKKEYNSNRNSQEEQKTLIRTIFLNLFINVFTIICYVYISEIFGSISTIFIENSEFVVHFGITLFVFTFFSILAGKFHGLITGFIGELLFQLAYYKTIYFYWCVIIAIWGFMCGIYKYKPLKYQDKTKVLYTFITLIIFSFISMLIIIIFQNIFFLGQLDIDTIIINYGFTFMVQAFLTIVFLVPLILILYDRALATKERHLYYVLLTHHPLSMSDHTFYLKFGRTYVYFCSRCSGVIIGGLVANFFTHMIEKIYYIDFNPEIAVLLCIILPIPGLVDWGTQRMLLRKSTTESRLFTGFVIGSALHLISFTQKYYFFMIFLIIFYFSIVGILMFFGHKKEMKLLKEESN